MIRVLPLIACLCLAACGTPRPAPTPPPIIVPVKVAVPVVGACVPATLAPAPNYPDTDEALRGAKDAAERYQLLAAGRPLRIARNQELETVVAGCPKATK